MIVEHVVEWHMKITLDLIPLKKKIPTTIRFEKREEMTRCVFMSGRSEMFRQ